MKKILLIIISLSIVFASCNLFFENDESSYVSLKSSKPIINIKGEKIISIEKGKDTYIEQGANVVVGDTQNYKFEIFNSPNVNQKGCYIVKYSAINGFGWNTNAYRSVLVWEGNPYSTEPEGNYKVGFKFKSSIVKYSVLGYYSIDNCYAAEGYVFPIIFADNGDGKTYTIVPGEHPSLGSYFGTARDSVKLTKKYFIVNIKTVIPGQDTSYKQFIWQKI